MSQVQQFSPAQAHQLYLDQCAHAAKLASQCVQSGGETDDGTEYLAHALELASMLAYACLDGGGASVASFMPKFLATAADYSGDGVAPSIQVLLP